MPFSSYEELINMAKNNPEEARKRVLGARKKKLPIVSENNPGYSRNIGGIKGKFGSPKKYKYINSGAMQSRGKAITRRISMTKRNVASIPHTRQKVSSPPGNQSRSQAISKRMTVARSRDEITPTPSSEKKAILKRKKVGY